MKDLKWCFLFLSLITVPLLGHAQTIKQFNGLFDIVSIKANGSDYEIVGNFTDLNSNFSASDVALEDQIVDNLGNSFKILTITSISGAKISTVCSSLNGTFPSGGSGIIYRPTLNGYPLITNSTPNAVLNTIINTSTLSINSDIPVFQSGASLPTISSKIGDVVMLLSTSKLYVLNSSGWTENTTTIPTSTATSITNVVVKAVGSFIFLVRKNTFYVSDGTKWIEIPSVTELPLVSKSGDIFYETGQKELYMMVDGENTGGGAEWMPISSGGIPGGGTVDFPTTPKAGDLFFNTDNNILYLYDINSMWVEISSNGSNPSGFSNPDPLSPMVKEGQLFYNTSERRLFVYNGTDWLPVGNSLANGQIFVGNSSNVATPVSLSGDGVITNTGKFTVNDKAITDAKLDKSNIPLSGFGNPVTDVNLGDGTTNYKIINLKNPSALQDAATKAYVDNMFANPTNLTLANGNFLVGNALNKATAVAKSTIPLSGFGNPAASISMNGKAITNLASPSNDADAANKLYVDNRPVYPINISLYQGMLLLGNAQDKAGMIEKKDIPVSDFGAATTDISLGSFKLTNMADPVAAQDASTKNYVDTKIFPSTNIALASGNLLVGNSSGVAAATLKNAIPLSGFGAATADISLGTSRIVSLGAPVADTDASTKKYVDDLFLSPSSILSLPAGSFFVGNSFGKATPTIKASIPVSGFGKATETVYMGDPSTQYNISNLAEPMSGKDAATKNYVDTRIANPSSITVVTDYVLVGNAANQAEAVAKNTIPLSDFGAVNANLSLGNYKITNLADPVSDGDAVNKKYITTQLSNVNTLLSLPEGQLFLGNASGKAAAVAKNTIPVSNFGAATANLVMGNGSTNNKITNLADPTDARDAATKNYVDEHGILHTDSYPINPKTGQVIYLTIADHLYFYNGSRWSIISDWLKEGSMFVGDADDQAISTNKNAIPISGFGDASANVSMGTGSNNYKIINLSDPTGDQDAATKKYVDAKTAGVTTGTTPPANPTAGTTYYNTTNKTLYVYDGSQWVPVDNKLASGQLYVGDAQNKAVATAKNTIPLSGFAAAAADVALGSFKLTGVADPSADQDAATKKYVDAKTAGVTTGTTPPANPTAGTTYYNTTDKTLYVYDGSQWVPVDNKLATGQLYVGDAQNKAVATAKNTIPLSGFAAAAADVALGSFKLTGVADPSADQDAATKKYVDAKTAGVTTGTTPLANPTAGTTYYNTTDKTLYVYDGSQWVPVDNKLASGQLYVGDAQNKAVATAKNTIPLSGFAAAAADVALGSFKLTGIADPSADQDAATKKYVDAKTAGVTTGTTPPANPTAGTTYYNTTDKTLYVYDGSQWVPVDNKLATGQLYVGDAQNKAVATAKNTIPLSGFAAAAADVALGSFKLTGVADPSADQDAATKKYVDSQLTTVNSALSLPQGNMLVGDANGKAASTAKGAITLSGFGDASANVSMGTGSNNYKIINLSDPTGDQDAATKKYVDAKTAGVTTGTTPPANPTAGTTYYNTTDKTLYVYDGSQWVPVDNKLATGQLYVGDAQNKAVATAKNTIPLSGFAAAAADVALGSFKLTGVADPSADQDAATKKYVDGLVASSALPALADGKIFVGNVSGKATPVSLSGDATIDNTGKMAITDDAVSAAKLNADVAGSGLKQDVSGALEVDVTTISGGSISSTDLLVTGGSNAALTNVAISIPDKAITDAKLDKTNIPLSGFGPAAANVALGSFKLTGVADPSADQDAATKKYVDAKTAGVTTGTTPPTNPTAGTTYYNTTDKTLYVYDGSQWVPVDNKLASGQLYVGDAQNKAVATAKNTIPLSGFAAAAADVALGSFKLTGVADPSADQDAATKKYVDSQLTTVNSALSLPQGNMLVGDANGKAASTAKGAITLSGFGDASANVSMGTGSNNYKIINLADPTGDQDAATKKYVDAKTAGVTTGTTPPANPTAGTTYYNTTDKTLYVYDGSQWIPVDNKLASGQLYVGDAQNKAVATAKNTIPLSGFAAAAADVALGSFKLTGVADPSADQDAATKKYVDGLVAGVNSVFSLAKGNMLVGDDSGKAASTAKSAITLSGFKEAEANISMGSGSNNYKITNLADPTGDQDAATKKYVDNTAAASKDNLGNHTATQALKMGSYSVSNDGDTGDGVAFDTNGHATFGKDVTVNGNFYTPSDERLKTDIETLTNVLEKINNLRGVQFEYKDQKKYAKGPKMGVIAQELLLVYPEMVTKGDDGYLKVDYTQLTAVLIQAVKEQQQQIKQQQQDIDEMKVRLDKQQQQINSILMQLK